MVQAERKILIVQNEFDKISSIEWTELCFWAIKEKYHVIEQRSWLMRQKNVRKRFTLTGVLIGLVLGLGLAIPCVATETPKLKTGAVIKQTYYFKLAEKQMKYCLYLPKAYDKTKDYPLVVALHGLYSFPVQIINYPGLLKQAEKYGYVVVAPMGYNRKGWYGSMGWTMRKSTPKNLGELSEKDVMNVVAITRKKVSIDPKRIYLMGHSMGGGGTWHLGLKYPELWAALAPIAPAIYRKPDALAKIKTMPVILVQGDSDPLVPVKIARAWAAKMKELKMDHKYIEISDGGHVKIAFDSQPAIFEFFNTHHRKIPAPTKPVGTDGSEVDATPREQKGPPSTIPKQGG